MEKPDKYYKEIEKKFCSGNRSEILNTLKEIRFLGKAIIMPLVFQVLNNDPDDEIKDEIFNILSQLKDKECVPYIIDAIQSEASNSYITKLITTCWQSGLDYSEHILIFAEQFIKGDYQTAIESFSVIEEWIFESVPAQIFETKKFLIHNIDKVSEDKKPLYHELVKVVDSHMNDFTPLL